MKKVEAFQKWVARQTAADLAVGTAVRALIPLVVEFAGRWLKVAAVMDQAKPLIVKGRKPSETPKATPDRTLENTGTCPVCGRNHKLTDGGRIVRHGYEVHFHSFVGDCFAVGYQPWEVAPNGAVAFVAAVRRRIAEYAQNLEHVNAGGDLMNEVNDQKAPGGRRFVTVKNGEPGYDYLQVRTRDRIEGEIRMMTLTAEDFDKRIAAWKPAQLPGVKAGFAR